MIRPGLLVLPLALLAACATEPLPRQPQPSDYTEWCRGIMPGAGAVDIGNCARKQATLATEQIEAANAQVEAQRWRYAIGQGLSSWGQAQTLQSLAPAQRPVICRAAGPGVVICQ